MSDQRIVASTRILGGPAWASDVGQHDTHIAFLHKGAEAFHRIMAYDAEGGWVEITADPERNA